ncbi:MAG TPA: hypothetical protein VI685_23315 [Candidatus Angelobacter sp.]
MQCQKTKRGGKRCGAHALADKKYCALHADPGRAAALGAKGGRRRTVYHPEGLKQFATPKSAAELRDLLAESIIKIRAGKLDPKIANVLGYLGASYLRALEMSDLEERLEELSEAMSREEHGNAQAQDSATADVRSQGDIPKPGRVR